MKGLPHNIEILFMLVFGILLQITDGSPFTIQERWKIVWDTELPANYFSPLVQKLIKTVLSIIVVVRCVTTYAYVVFAMLVIFSILKESLPKLMLPWLIVAGVKSICLTFLEALTGVYVCSAFGKIRKACIEFFISKALEIIFAAYMWGSVLNIYQDLERRSKKNEKPDLWEQLFIQRMDFRHKRARSLLDESTLYKTACLNYFEFKDVPQIIMQMLRRDDEMSQDSLLGPGMMLASVSNIGSYDNLKTSQSLGELGVVDLRTTQVVGLEEEENLSVKEKALKYLKITWADVNKARRNRRPLENNIYEIDQDIWDRLESSRVGINKPKEPRGEVYWEDFPQLEAVNKATVKTVSTKGIPEKLGLPLFMKKKRVKERRESHFKREEEEEEEFFEADEEDESKPNWLMSNIKDEALVHRIHLQSSVRTKKGSAYAKLFKEAHMMVVGPEVFDKASKLLKITSLPRVTPIRETSASLSVPLFWTDSFLSRRKLSSEYDSPWTVTPTLSTNIEFLNRVRFSEDRYSEETFSFSDAVRIFPEDKGRESPRSEVILGGDGEESPRSEVISGGDGEENPRSEVISGGDGEESLRSELSEKEETEESSRSELSEKEETEESFRSEPMRNEETEESPRSELMRKDEGEESPQQRSKGRESCNKVMNLDLKLNPQIVDEKLKTKICIPSTGPVKKPPKEGGAPFYRSRRITIRWIGQRKQPSPAESVDNCSTDSDSRPDAPPGCDYDDPKDGHADPKHGPEDPKYGPEDPKYGHDEPKYGLQDHPENWSSKSDHSNHSFKDGNTDWDSQSKKTYYTKEVLQKPLIEVLITYYDLRKREHVRMRTRNLFLKRRMMQRNCFPGEQLNKCESLFECSDLQQRDTKIWKSKVLEVAACQSFGDENEVKHGSSFTEREVALKRLLKSASSVLGSDRRKLSSGEDTQGKGPERNVLGLDIQDPILPLVLFDKFKSESATNGGHVPEVVATRNLAESPLSKFKGKSGSSSNPRKLSRGSKTLVMTDTAGEISTASTGSAPKKPPENPEGIDFICRKMSTIKMSDDEPSLSSDLEILKSDTDLEGRASEIRVPDPSEGTSDPLQVAPNKQDSDESVSIFYSKAADLASPLLDMKRFIYPDHIHYSYKHVKKKGFDVDLNGGLPLIVRESLTMNSPVNMRKVCAPKNPQSVITRRPMDLSFAKTKAFAEWQNNDADSVTSEKEEGTDKDGEEAQGSKSSEPPASSQGDDDIQHLYSTKDSTLIAKVFQMHASHEMKEETSLGESETERTPVQISSTQLHSNKGRIHSTCNPAIFLQETKRKKMETERTSPKHDFQPGEESSRGEQRVSPSPEVCAPGESGVKRLSFRQD